jgi:hypothetical protein
VPRGKTLMGFASLNPSYKEAAERPRSDTKETKPPNHSREDKNA